MKSTTVKILALLLVVCALFGVAACSNFGAEEATTEPRSDSATPLDKLMVVEDGKANVDYKATIKYFNDLMVKLNSDDVKAKINYSCEYDFNSFDSGNAELDAALRTLGKLIKDGFNSQYATEDDKLEYGDNFAEIVPIKGSDKPLVLKESDIAVYQLKEGEERLYDDGHTLIFINEEAVTRYLEASSRDAEAMKEDPEATTEYIELDEEPRKVTITLKDEVDPQKGANLFGEIYDIPDRDFIKTELGKLNNYVTYDTYKATYTGCQIYMEIDRVTDEIIKLEFRRNIEIEMEVTGNPNNEITKDLGTTTLKFKVTGADVYEFDYTDPKDKEE